MTISSHNLHAFVTGASGGLGSEIALALAYPGSVIGVHYFKNEEKAHEISGKIIQKKASPYLVHADLSKKDSAEIIAEQIRSKILKLNVLVLNAGAASDNLIINTSEKEWDSLMQLNYKTPAKLLNSLAESSLAKGCHVIITGSLTGLKGKGGLSAYAASKGALIGFTRDAAEKYAKKEILVNAILPGWLKTQMTEGLTDAEFDDLSSENLLGRPTTCKEVAEFVSYLTKLKNVSGQVFALDSRPAIP